MPFSARAKNGVASVLATILVSTATTVPLAIAEDYSPQIHGSLVLADSMFYDPSSDKVRLDESRIDYRRVNQAEIDQVRTGLENLTDQQINQVLADNNYDPATLRKSDDSGASVRIAPAVIWGGVAILGILAGGGLIFYAMYTSHEEKQNLINQCYDNGGRPVIDSRDSAGIEGTTNSGAAEQAGGYRFECQK